MLPRGGARGTGEGEKGERSGDRAAAAAPPRRVDACTLLMPPGACAAASAIHILHANDLHANLFIDFVAELTPPQMRTPYADGGACRGDRAQGAGPDATHPVPQARGGRGSGPPGLWAPTDSTKPPRGLTAGVDTHPGETCYPSWNLRVPSPRTRSLPESGGVHVRSARRAQQAGHARKRRAGTRAATISSATATSPRLLLA